jgi:two-component system response regulator RegA
MVHVLLLEDDFLISMMLEDELRDLGHCVVSVATVELGLALLRQRPPDFAIVDFQLADGNSSDLISQMQKRQIPFVLVTGSQIDRTDASLADVEVLTKPVNLDQLTKILMRAHVAQIRCLNAQPSQKQRETVDALV